MDINKLISIIKIKNSVFYLFVFLLIIFNLLTLNYSPLPWFDEVYFASITKSYSETGLFKFYISPLYDSGEVLRYGPLYFIFTSIIVKIFGFGLFQYRILNFVASVLCIYIASLILKKYKLSNKDLFFFITIYLFDVMFVMNSHSGRMDGVALLFVLIFHYLVLNYNKNYWNLPLSGVAFAISILTTPRSVFFMLPIIFYFGFVLMLHLKKDKNYLRLLSWAIPPIILYLFWIFIKFGSIQSYFDYYLQKRTTEHGSDSYLETFIQFSPYIFKFQIPLFVVTTLSIILLIFSKAKKHFFIFISLANIFIFYGFILDTGMYSIFILPFYYLIIFLSFNINPINNKLKYSIYIFLLLFNLSTFVIKNTGIVLDLKLRDYKRLNSIVNQNIPKNSRVIGNEVYFYTVIQNNCDFQTIERGGNWLDRYDYQAKVFDFDYLILNEQFIEDHKGIFSIYHVDEMEVIQRIKLGDEKNSITIKISNLLDIPNPMYSYNGIIYKRKKMNE